MKNHKLMIRAVTLLLALSATAPALAGGTPTSQFYFSGWPYRQPADCWPATFPDWDTPAVDPDAAPTAAPTPAPSAIPTAKPPVPTAKPVQTPSAPDYTTDSLTTQEQTALKLLNQDRQRNGLPPLSLDPQLSRLARLKSEDMRDNRYFAHTSPTYGSASAMLKSFGYSFNSVGENIAHHATVDKSQAAFMSSNAHRRNILGSQWTKCGIGVAYDANGFVYVTQLFVR